jgi:DNA-binding NarL/FixJ family response regulator
MINLMLVEDNDIVREALTKLFKTKKDITVVAAVIDGAAAIDQLQLDSTIDIVMADWNMPKMSGLELTSHITEHYPTVKTVILTMHGKQEYKDKAKAAGAKGFILKDGDFNDLVAVVRDVVNGKIVYS